MRKQTKQFERSFIRSRNAIERKGITMAKAAIKAQYVAFLERAKTTDKSRWIEIIDTAVNEKPIQIFFDRFYPMSAPLGVMVRNNLLKGKGSEENQIMENSFRAKLTKIVQNEAGKKITSITNTTKDRLVSVVRNVLDEADTEGWGIDKITSNLYKQVGANLAGNGYARARAIAQTEMISASNQASEYAASSTGYDYLKFWSTSGLENIRESHLEAERYSDEKGGLKPDELFPNGLLYPGDPNGAPEEIINCRCSLMHEIVTGNETSQPNKPETVEQTQSTPTEENITEEQVYERIDEGEKGIVDNSYETLISYDEKGNELLRVGGDHRSVEIPDEKTYLLKNSITTHNHPQSRSFSFEDMDVAVYYNVKEFRAVGTKATYIIERPESGWPKRIGFREQYKRIEREITDKVIKQVDNNEITIDYANFHQHHLINKEFSKKFNFKYKRILK